jgi:hypothetical protein
LFVEGARQHLTVFLAIKLAIFMALLAGAGGAFLYVRNLQATVAVLEANNVKLESAVNATGKKRDIGSLAEQKPALMAKVINRGTKNAMRCMEIAMGSSLTEKEKNATKKSQINPECSDIANPSYVRY